jgi:hypothetical protein
MRKGWIERIQDTISHLHGSRWRPTSTAPYNQDLELQIVEDGKTIALPFPCRHTNEGEWINVDLGTGMRIQPARWRIWSHRKSPRPHHSSIKGDDRITRHLHQPWTGNDAASKSSGHVSMSGKEPGEE